VILKDLLPKRKDLKLILMSATLNSQTFSKYFGNCPTITIPGFTHPVKEHFLEDAILETGYKLFPGSPYFKRATQSGKKKGVEYLSSTMPGPSSYIFA
jgi:HrpA-like RNA helicase